MFYKYFIVIGIAMLPILELKAAIPVGVFSGIPLWETFILAVIGSSIPIPFILFFIKKIIHWMQKSKVNLFNRFSNWLVGKVEKHKGKIEKYAYLGLFAFVAIPLPGTGVWTGSLIAAMLDLKLKYSMPVIIVGNIVAGLIMLFVTRTIHVAVA